jgi:hypothetical protein
MNSSPAHLYTIFFFVSAQYQYALGVLCFEIFYVKISGQDGQILKSIAIIDEMKGAVQPNDITYSVLIIACEKYDFLVYFLYCKT